MRVTIRCCSVRGARGTEIVPDDRTPSGCLKRLVDELPEGKREALRLVHDAQMEIQQAAEELGVPEGTVKSRLYHARKQLTRRWQEFEKNNEKKREKQ